ncbi:hypothetical protein QFZ37_002920 [Chryseobacterium ginsenosidimutans]|uniref:hypothetical protein n=1 Tax=Chryseobacterium ginsenosidimutans TaxID=687846 RepID=UPI0027851478|nr:hypothetical protein [Chryseobacterium ginsenosidimutans]MDQ0594551.1 hypothetical protein [Chryseobacterium ginsenosidimutans]
MSKRNYIIIGILALITLLAIGCFIVLDGLSSMGNPNGGRAPDYPYFITTEPVTVKKIVLPKGTKLTYEEQFFREGQQDRIMNEKKLTGIELPKGKTIEWGGVPVYMITKFFNPEMKGFSVSANFGQLRDDRKTEFSEMWQSCDEELGVLVKNTDDWTFDTKNIVDISDCGVTYQRFFKEDTQQQRFLNKLLGEIKKVGKAK